MGVGADAAKGLFRLDVANVLPSVGDVEELFAGEAVTETGKEEVGVRETSWITFEAVLPSSVGLGQAARIRCVFANRVS